MSANLETVIDSAGESYLISEYQGLQGFQALKADWDTLWWSSQDATETQTWHWQYLYWKHLTPRADPFFVTARDARGVCVALAAFFCCRDQSSLVSKAAFLGDKRPDYHLILAPPDVPATVGLKILDRFAFKFKNRVACLELTNVPQNSYTGQLLGQFIKNNGDGRSTTLRWETQTYGVALPNTLEEYLRLLGPRSRRDFRYDRRKLCDAFSVEFRVYNTPGTIDEALDAVESVDRARWGPNSRYYLSAHRSFERSVAHALCEMGIYRAFILYLDGIPRAFVTGAVVRNLFKVASIGFDRSVPGKWSIGKVSNFYAIEHCIESALEQYDLTRGGEEYKKWLGATPSTNLHVRCYRSRFDQIADFGSARTISFLRRQTWLRGMYQRLLRR